MADSHSTLVTKPHLSGGRNEKRQSQTVHRRDATRRGEPSSPPDLEPEEEEIGAVPSMPFTHPRSANDHVHVMAPNPFRRWSMNRSLRFLSVFMTSALVMAACSSGNGGSAAPISGGGASAPAETAAGSAPAGGSPAAGGSLYAIMVKFNSKSTLWFRPDTFATAGVTAPKTWDDFKTALATLKTKSGTAPLGLGTSPDTWTLTDWFESIYLRQAGTDMYD